MPLTKKNADVTEELAGRADRVVQKLTGLSRSQISGLFDHDCVSVNGRRCNEYGRLVKAGDTVAVEYDAHRRYQPRPRQWEHDAFRIVFEDKHLIVIDKAPGVLTMAAHPGETNTVVHAITEYFQHSGGRERAQLVHRLDRGASGLLVFGKNREIAAKLQDQFESRKPEREYAAIVKGTVDESGTFESHLATSKSLQQFSTDRPGEGQLAITHYRRERIVHGCSLVRVWLETGRRNQIRVHFSEAGHPVLGDERYRPEFATHPQWKSKRLALHAAVLGFRHPVTGKELRFRSALPGVMKTFAGEKSQKEE